MARSRGKSILIFFRNHDTDFHSGLTSLYSNQQWMNAPLRIRFYETPIITTIRTGNRKKVDKNEKLWISNKLFKDYNDQQNQINTFMVCQMLVQAMTENKREAR